LTLVAYVSARAEALDDLKDDFRGVIREMPPPLRPARVYRIDKIPRLPSSKLDLCALMALDEINVQSERAHVAAGAGADCIARTVAKIWQEVLQAPLGGPEDDFFDAGGDSLKALRFMLGLERALGLDLSLTLITEAPKFAGLCEALRERRASRYVPLVQLKPGTAVPPVFIVHHLAGNVAGYFPMTRRMTWPGAVIGIQARGLDGRQTPHTTVEAMAAEYLSEVKARQPDGPYYLCGYSFGGLVAFEMARRLSEAGDEVALVGLFDTSLSPLRWPLRSWLSIVIEQWPSVWKGLRGILKSAPTRVLRVTASAMMASARYRPGFYPGELTLFTPLERVPGLPSLESIWRKHAGTLSIVETAGAHSTMFSAANAESTAASLTRCLLRR
jgi:thioesterase domain-containing protein/acyl carrier protein